ERELNEATGDSEYWDRLRALDEKYPSAQYPERTGRPPAGMNPVERARWELERIIRASSQDKPQYPGEDASPEEMQAYYAQMAAFKERQYDYIENSVNQLLSTDSRDSWYGEFDKLTRNQYAS